MKKFTINLYQEELKLVKPFITLPKVTLLWGGVFVVMAIWSLITSNQLAQQYQILADVDAIKQQQADYLVSLQDRVNKNKASSQLVEELRTLELLMTNKSQLLEQLSDEESTFTVGYSQAMTQLSELHHKDISLDGVKINRLFMTFSGIARKPHAIPVWLAKFEGATFLEGQTFNYLNLQEDEESEHKFTRFVVSSEQGGKGAKL